MASSATSTSVTAIVGAVEPARHERILDGVRRGIRCREGDRDHEVRGREAEQHQHEQLAAPPGQQPFEHGDRALALEALAGDAAIDRQGAEDGQQHEHDGGQGREQPRRHRRDRRLIAERREVVDAGQRHDPPPGALLDGRLGERSLVRAGLAPQALQQPGLQGHGTTLSSKAVRVRRAGRQDFVRENGSSPRWPRCTPSTRMPVAWIGQGTRPAGPRSTVPSTPPGQSRRPPDPG